MPSDIEEKIEHALNRAIALEQLREVTPEANLELADKMLAISPNPWDAANLYQLLDMIQKKETIDFVGAKCLGVVRAGM